MVNEYFLKSCIDWTSTTSGRMFIRDFITELEDQDHKVNEIEVRKLKQLADSDGQVEVASFYQYFTIWIFSTSSYLGQGLMIIAETQNCLRVLTGMVMELWQRGILLVNMRRLLRSDIRQTIVTEGDITSKHETAFKVGY